jgi:predicted MFS family arabinose efflux permease
MHALPFSRHVPCFSYHGSDGARFVVSHPFLRPIMITAIFFNVSWFVLQAAYVVYAVQELGLSAATVGMTLGVYGAGMVVGALLAPSIGRLLPFGTMIVVGPLFGLIGALVMMLTLKVPSAGLAALSFFSFGFGPIVWVITTTTLRQSVTPDYLLGRASSILMLATFGARPLGAFIGAVIGGLYGAHSCVIAAAGGFLVQFIVIITSRVSRLDRLPEGTVATPA